MFTCSRFQKPLVENDGCEEDISLHVCGSVLAHVRSLLPASWNRPRLLCVFFPRLITITHSPHHTLRIRSYCTILRAKHKRVKSPRRKENKVVLSSFSCRLVTFFSLSLSSMLACKVYLRSTKVFHCFSCRKMDFVEFCRLWGKR